MMRTIAMRNLPALSFILVAVLAHGLAHATEPAPRTFRVWVFADAHVDTDKRNGRESLAIALRQRVVPLLGRQQTGLGRFRESTRHRSRGGGVMARRAHAH